MNILFKVNVLWIQSAPFLSRVSGPSGAVPTRYTCKHRPPYIFHNLTHVHPPCARARRLTHIHGPPHPPTHPKLAIILNPSPAWVIPDNPRLILVNSGHSSAGFHPATTETGWGLVGSWRLRVGAALIDIIGRTVIGSQEKQAQVFFHGTSKKRPDWPLLRHVKALTVQNMFFSAC